MSCDALRKHFDRTIGLSRKVFTQHLALTLVNGSIVALFFSLYTARMGSKYEVTYGSLCFLLCLIDLIHDLKRAHQVSWMQLTRYEYIIRECFRICFLFIIPVLTINQYLHSDMSFWVLIVILTIPALYLAPYCRNFFGKQPLYILTLKANVLVNLIVSIRTTFYGFLCSIAVLFAWSKKYRTNKQQMWYTLLFFRFATGYLLYITLITVKINRCIYPKKEDSCAMSDEQCSFFRNYYYFQHRAPPCIDLPCGEICD